MQAESPEEIPMQKLIVDEEFIPFKHNSLDLVVSCLRLIEFTKHILLIEM